MAGFMQAMDKLKYSVDIMTENNYVSVQRVE